MKYDHAMWEQPLNEYIRKHAAEWDKVQEIAKVLAKKHERNGVCVARWEVVSLHESLKVTYTSESYGHICIGNHSNFHYVQRFIAQKVQYHR